MSGKKQTVWFLKGLPASGKSSWAREKIEQDRHSGIITKRVNKDDLRSMIDNSVHSKEREKFILKIRDEIIYLSLREGYNVIVDDTNFHPKHEAQIKTLIANASWHSESEINLEEKFFDTPLHECIKRDSERENPVGKAVIMDMYHRYLKNTEKASIIHDPELSNCLICDIDGTLALHGTRRSPFEYWKADEDRLNTPILTLLRSLLYYYDESDEPLLRVFIMTGRENLENENGDTIKDLTSRWLKDNNVPFDQILIRENGDHRPDWIVKDELYQKNIESKYNVLYVIDDRKQVIDMWREKGFTVLDVAGNEF